MPNHHQPNGKAFGYINIRYPFLGHKKGGTIRYLFKTLVTAKRPCTQTSMNSPRP